jgi:ATP-dependent helicase/nuclease subunit A
MNAAAIVEETTAAQRLAADPSVSAFVSANAGAGKTRVLTNRVARLLLNGVSPASVLCITFTKAAAAEMAERLFKLLGGWALADDATLTAGLNDLDGDQDRKRTKEELSRARRLFAQALETPGGLKIQTIHSFCESVLKRFPLEAGVPPGFTVIDALEAARIARDAVLAVATRRGDDPALEAAFTHLLSRMNGAQLRTLLDATAGADRRAFGRAAEVGWAALADEARTALGAELSINELRRKIATLRSGAEFERVLAAYEACGGNPGKYGVGPIKEFLSAFDDARRVEALSRLFLTGDGLSRKNFATKALDDIDAGARSFFDAAQQDFLALRASLDAAVANADTQALYIVVRAVHAAYAGAKAARGALDFDDLITATRRLLREDGKADWVLYKLDQGLDHILLDEAQDTGPDAWDVIERPLAEFFSGLGARTTPRTFFAVGDKKQSIYSFQGADAQLFDAKENDLGKKISAAARYANVPLKASFRTTAPILTFVDALFERREVFNGVSDAAPEHHCTRAGEAGLVELWPLVRREQAPPAKAWDAPLDQPAPSHPAKKLAEAVAGEIRDWLDSGAVLESKGKAIVPGDVMILVQKRKALFHEMIRALARKGVPVAGADRLKLVEDQAVLDLLSYARAALHEGDDLALAETLKSPFFNVGEERLFELAAARGRMSLWRRLVERAGECADWEVATREIAAARNVGLRHGPVAFFMHILETGAPAGWRRLAARLGAPSREPVEEFLRLALDFEATHPRSLRLFLDAIRRSDAEANRDSADAGDSVRVMTAHKAKGLESNIVFLIDAHSPPKLDDKKSLIGLSGPTGDGLPVLALGDSRAAPALAAAAARAKDLAWEEYRRLLYVAATRARDRLYICGHEHGNQQNPQSRPAEAKSWHALAIDAFDALGGAIETGEERFGGRIRRFSVAQEKPPQADRQKPPSDVETALPPWAALTAPPEKRLRRLSPSALAPETGAAYRPGRSGGAFLRGRTLHRLLEILPGLAPARRPDAARRMARRIGAKLGEAAADALADEAMRVINDPQFAPVFAPGGLSEAAIGGAPKGARAGLVVSGQIDRLAIGDRRILIVDYKTNRPPPAHLEDVDPGYIAQLAAYRALLQEIYPAHEVEAALLWTYDARLMPVPAEALDRAFALTLA